MHPQRHKALHSHARCRCLQPEVCSNISGAPSDVFHRASAARKCMLHSLCVLPLWLPAVSTQAPVAVLEVLQPDPQPDFDQLCIQVRFVVNALLLQRLCCGDILRHPRLLSSSCILQSH